MNTYKVILEIEAEDEVERDEKLQAFQDLVDNMEHEDLISATDLIVDNPEIVAFIKEVAPEEGQELSRSDYIRIAIKAFKTFG